jgi:hypothetical protein
LADLKNQVANLKLLVSSVESDLAARDEGRMVARTTEAYLVALRKNLAEVERDTEEASRAAASLPGYWSRRPSWAATRRAGPR